MWLLYKLSYVLTQCRFFTGDIAISGDVILTLNRGPSPPFTLTCISTGGPATTVTWTRDSTTVTEGNETMLNDPVNAQYTHTLTVRGRLGGVYKCTVENNKPSKKSKSFTVKGLDHTVSLLHRLLSVLQLPQLPVT